jgi:putative ABC transport system permease protein
MDVLWKNLVYSARVLWKKPSLTAVAIIAIGLGIGANTAIFSVVNTVLLQPLPYPQPKQLVMISSENRNQALDGRGAFSVPDFLDVQQSSKTLEYVAVLQGTGTITTEGESERLLGAAVSADYFNVLGVKPEFGRVFSRDEDKEGAASVILISHALWQRRYGGDPNIIGREIDLGGKTTVVGVMPAGFKFPISDEPQDFWEPIFSAAFMTKERREERANRFLPVIGRLKPGVTLEQAKADLDLISRQVEQHSPVSNTSLVFNVVSMHEDITRDYRPALLVMLGAVGLVLLIACANVANLLLARAVARQKEIAIRMALGASRRRIAGQLLTESVLLSLAGGALGLLLATWGTDLLVAYGPADVPRLRDVGLDRYVLFFTLGIAMLTGIVFGLAPALHASKPDPGNMMKDSGRGLSNTGRNRMRSALIVSEVALSLMLLAGAGLLINSFWRLLQTDAGFDPKGVLALDIPLNRATYTKPEQRSAAFQQLIARMKTLPGVRDASVVSNVPLTDFDEEVSFQIEGRPPYKPGEEAAADYTLAGGDYFRTMDITLLRGRVFTDSDTSNSPHVMVVSNAFAKHFFPDEDAIGKRIILDGNDRTPREIVGIVEDVRRNGLDANVQPEMYFSHLQNPTRRMNLVIRTTAEDASQLTPAARAEVKAFDPQQIIWRAQTLEQLLSTSVAPRKFNMLLLGIFAGVALVLAAVGLYGVMSYSVSWRTQEIGIRMALGAKRADVLRMVVRQGMTMTLIGLALGLVGVVAMSRVIAGMLYGVSATDPLTFAGVSIVLLAVALLACLIPARRATRVDPLVALRSE